MLLLLVILFSLNIFVIGLVISFIISITITFIIVILFYYFLLSISLSVESTVNRSPTRVQKQRNTKRGVNGGSYGSKA